MVFYLLRMTTKLRNIAVTSVDTPIYLFALLKLLVIRVVGNLISRSLVLCIRLNQVLVGISVVAGHLGINKET